MYDIVQHGSSLTGVTKHSTYIHRQQHYGGGERWGGGRRHILETHSGEVVCRHILGQSVDTFWGSGSAETFWGKGFADTLLGGRGLQTYYGGGGLETHYGKRGGLQIHAGGGGLETYYGKRGGLQIHSGEGVCRHILGEVVWTHIIERGVCIHFQGGGGLDTYSVHVVLSFPNQAIIQPYHMYQSRQQTKQEILMKTLYI